MYRIRCLRPTRLIYNLLAPSIRIPEPKNRPKRRRFGCFYSEVVRLGTLDTKNWKSLLQFRERLLQRGWPRPGSEKRDFQATAVMQEAGTGNSNSNTTPPPEQSTVVRRITHIENRPISREKRAAIRREADGALGARAVAERHGVHESTVRAIWRQRPRPARRGPHRFTQEDRQRAEVLVARASPYRHRPGARVRPQHGTEAPGCITRIGCLMRAGQAASAACLAGSRVGDSG